MTRRRIEGVLLLGLLFAIAAVVRPGAESAMTARPPSSSPSADVLAPPPRAPLPPISRWDRHVQAHPQKGKFERFFRMTATAYTPINTRMEGGRFTFTERDGRSAHGIAVDPDLIPLGSRLWIPGYGHGIADDIGGRIQGHRVDVRIQDYERMNDWGVRRLRVYVLADAPRKPQKSP